MVHNCKCSNVRPCIIWEGAGFLWLYVHPGYYRKLGMYDHILWGVCQYNDLDGYVGMRWRVYACDKTF